MRLPLLCCLLAVLLVLTGCGGGSNPIAVSLSPGSAQSAMAGQTVSISATVSNDSKSAGVTWSLSGPGALSGQTTSAVTYTAPSPISANATATVTATSVSDSSKVQSLVINLQAVSITLAPASPLTLEQGQTAAITATISSDPQTKGVTWALSGAGALSGQAATAVTYTAPASITSASTATVTATSVFDNTKNTPFTINLVPPPSITTASLAAGQVNTAYSVTLAGTGGATPYTWSITAGTLPAGLTLAGSTIAGTPTATGTSNFTVQLKDATNVAVTKALSITINQPPAITSGNSTTFTAGAAGTFTVTATGFPTPTLSESGTLPAGVTFTDNGNATATLSGTASTTGNYPITITASNGIGTNATQSFTLTIGQAAAITSGNSATFVVGTAGTFSVTTTGFPKPSLTETGTLPSGVTFKDNGDGTATLAGTAVPTTGKPYVFTITAHNGVGSNATQSFTLTVNEAPSFASANSATFSLNAAGTFTVAAAGFPAPTLSESGALPAGVTFTPNSNGTATLSGTATAAGTFPITITATNGIGTAATQNFTLTVNTAPAITSGNNVTFLVGSGASFTVTTVGTPTPTLTKTGTLPTGMTFTDNGNGTATLTGPAAAGTGGTYSITITAHNSVGTATQTLTVTIDEPPSITSPSSTTFTIGQSGSLQITTTGFPTPIALSETGALPTGVTFTDNGNSTATLAGTPAPGSLSSYSFTITANNGVTPNATQSFTLTVNQPAPIVISPATGSLPNGVQNASYSTTISATGGIQPYTFSLDASSAALPAGLTLTNSNPGQHNNTGVISGSPTATGTTSGIIIDVTDSNATVQKVTYSITVSAAVADCSEQGSGNESVLSGQYAFLLQGWQGSGTGTPVAIVGSFHADGSGNITGTGDFDINSAGGYAHATISSTGSSYKVKLDSTSAGYLGCAVFKLSTGATQVFRFSLAGLNAGVSSRGRIIEFDDASGTGTRDSGVIRSQDTTSFSLSKLQPHYAFGSDGIDPAGNHHASGGYFSVNTSGTISSAYSDTNDNGTLNTKTGGTGTIGAPSATTGRAVMSTTFGSNTSNLAAYMVNANEVFYIGSDSWASKPIYAGRAIVAAASFSQSSLSGKYIIHMTRYSTTGCNGNPCGGGSLGLVNLAAGAISGTIYDYDMNSTSGPTVQTLPGGSTYTVDPSSGRTVISGAGSGAPILYVAAPTSNTEPINAFLVSTDNSAGFGFSEAQTSATYSTAGLAGNWIAGNEDPGDNTVRNEVVVATISSSGSCTGTHDQSGQNGLTPDTSLTGGGGCQFLVNSDGSGTLGSSSQPLFTNGSRIIFLDGSGGPAVITVIEKQ